MLNISILKVENPSCLWARVTRSLGGVESQKQYEDLQVRMNLFYHNVSLDAEQLKPSSIEEGQVCVVFCSSVKGWCRAVVESVVLQASGCVETQVGCLLVDHGEHVVVTSDQIRTAQEGFLQLPFWARRFRLAGIRPTTLRISICEEKAELTSSSQWDSSATRYLFNLLRASSQMEALLKEEQKDSIELYLTVQDVKICVNDDLVAKRFAYYSSTTGGGHVLQEHAPAMLACDIFSDTKRFLASRGCSVRTTFPTAPNHAAVFEKRRVADLEPENGTTFSSALEWRLEEEEEEEDEEEGDSRVQDAPKHPDSVPMESRPRPQGAARTSDGEEEKACEQLLAWLNPEPEATDEKVVHSDPSRQGVLLHSVLPVEPCNSLADAPLSGPLRRVLIRLQYSSLAAAERYAWPAVARGDDVIMVAASANQPLSYLPPLLTHLQLTLPPVALGGQSGPLVVILCPGWEKAQVVSDLLDDLQLQHTFHPITVLVGVAKDEAKAVKIPKNCLLLVTTPFSLQRLLCCHCFLFMRLSHLVLDQAEQLFSLAPQQMASILQHYKKVSSSCPGRIVAVAKTWSSHMEELLANHMSCPCVVITLPKEAALYAGVHQMILLALENTKISVLLGALDFNPGSGQKTLIITNSAEEVEHVFQAVSKTPALCLKANQDSTHLFNKAAEQWNKDISAGTQVIMVTTDESLKALGIRDASCVVHYSFPPSPRLFGTRLFSMVHHFRNLSNQDVHQHAHCALARAPRSLLLMSERNASHVEGVLRYLRRAACVLPAELLSFAQGVEQARERSRSSMLLCSALKSVGVCRNSSVCPDRHWFDSQLDQSQLPASGMITVLPLCVHSASVYSGRIVDQTDNAFHKMASGMVAYYAAEKLAVVELEEGGLYAVQEGGAYHRVKVLRVPQRGDQLFFNVPVLFVDEGREQEVRFRQLLQLPLRFQVLSGQAVELILCRVQPADGELCWNPEATRIISQKICGVEHRARAVLSLGNTVFIDPMVKLSRLPGVKTVINEHDVRCEILRTGMGTSNPEHLDLLKALCEGGGAADRGAANQRAGATELGPDPSQSWSHAQNMDLTSPGPEGPEGPGGALRRCTELLEGAGNQGVGGFLLPASCVSGVPPAGENGPRFVEDTGEDHDYVGSLSGSESD